MLDLAAAERLTTGCCIILSTPSFCAVLHKQVCLWYQLMLQYIDSSQSYHESSFIDRLFALQLLEQQVTSSHERSHFFRHVNGRLHTTHIFSGKLDLLGFFSFLSLPPRPLPNNLVVILVDDDAADVIFEWATVEDGSINEEQLRPISEDELAKSQAAAINCNL